MKSQKLFDKYNDGQHWKDHSTAYSEKFADFLRNKNLNNRLIDAGCGNGRDVQVLNSAGFNVVGIDYSKKEIELAKKNFPSLKFEVQNIEKMKFKDNSISAFFCINIMHYVDQEKAINEFYRTLENKGYIFIQFNLEIKDKNENIDYKNSEKNILRLVSGFKIIKKEIVYRTDKTPIEHTHKILELILQK
ncbi:MAG: class I SAM-dependent methyltransferase [Candidatus Pacearchaeota archaeon]|jgi:ubiquinone/menaquinone biosynthesis C-methylase UbiE